MKNQYQNHSYCYCLFIVVPRLYWCDCYMRGDWQPTQYQWWCRWGGRPWKPASWKFTSFAPLVKVDLVLIPWLASLCSSELFVCKNPLRFHKHWFSTSVELDRPQRHKIWTILATLLLSISFVHWELFKRIFNEWPWIIFTLNQFSALWIVSLTCI